jgi:hypothetical protein
MAVRCTTLKKVQDSVKDMRALLACLMIGMLIGCGGGGTSPPPVTSASLSYPSDALTLVLGTAMSVDTPTVAGTLSNFSEPG